MVNTTSKPKVEAAASVVWRRRARFVRSRTREVLKIGKALVSTKHPFLVHIIPMRRCNLDCGYCNEYDDVSKPVPLEEMKRRLDLLADMGTSMITISGGEPLMHPEIEEVIRHMRKRGIYAGMITNGFLLSKDRIAKLNDAGLEFLQISIDNVTPDEVSKKSLKTLDSRLEWLSQYAVFQVNINSVLGSGVKNPEDALTIAKRAVELGFTSTVGIIHDGAGQLKGLNPRQIEIFEEIMSMGKSSFSRFNDFQHNVAEKSTTGDAGRARVICISARTGWCTGARSSAGIRGFRWINTRRRCGTGNISRRNIARRSARCLACSRWGFWIIGAGSRT
jgi:molybdenum cofactor biosynthesis enzyme MoaA